MPATPTNLQPINLSTVTTSNFGVACALQVSPLKQQAQWQVSPNFDFTGGPRTITSDLRNPGSLSMRVGTPRIPQGVFYVRVRAIDELGAVSPWSTAQSFTIFHPSTGLPRTPANGASVVWVGGNTDFVWDFFDTSDIDTQTAYQIKVIVSPDDATYTNLALLYGTYEALAGANATYNDLKAPPSVSELYSTGKIPSTTARTATLPLPIAARNRASRWQVQTWDNDDTSAGLSAPSLMFIGDLPVVVIISPVGSTAIPSPPIIWSYSSSSSSPSKVSKSSFGMTTRDRFSHSSPIINSTGTSYTAPAPVFQNLRVANITVRVTSANGMQGAPTTVVTPQWITPPSPSFLMDRSFYDTGGFVDLDWSDAIQDPTFVSWKVYRRADITAEWETVGTTQNKSFRDFNAPPNDAVEYAVTQAAVVQGEVTESSLIPQSIDLTSSIYLLTVEGEGIALRLYNVVSDDFTKEYEESVMNIVGVGRKAEVGSTWGMKGTLGLQLRDSVGQGMASEQWRLLEEVKDQGKTCVLRIPFGRILKVHVGNLNASRIAGVTSEIMDVTFDYTEVR